MTNVFIVPAVNRAAQENLERTIKRPVTLSDLRGLSPDVMAAARKSRRRLFAWGTKPGKQGVNVATWQVMEPGDRVLFYFEQSFPFAGRVLARDHSREVASRLWGADDGGTWEYLYLMDELRRLDAPRLSVIDVFGYKRSFHPQKFSRVNRSFGADGGEVERTLADLLVSSDALDRAVAIARADDRGAAIVAADRLGSLFPDRASREEAIRTRTSSDPPRERLALQRRIERDRALAVSIKKLYDGRCQCCGFTFLKRDGTPYAEAAHLRRISLREADLDVKDNVLVLCPNHHKMLDYGAMEIEYDADMDLLLWRLDGSVTELENKHIGPGRPG